MWEPLKRYNALDGEARRMFWRAVVLLPMVRISLRTRGYKKTQERLDRRLARIDSFRNAGDGIARIERTCGMVRAAAHYGIGNSSCLDESLVLWYLLRSQGVATSLRIGVRKENEEFAAHAWVEHEGVALNQKEEIHRHYVAFDREFTPPVGQP